MLQDEMLQALLTQASHELSNSVIYTCLSGECSLQGYNGFAKYFAEQAGDEVNHYSKIIEYLKKNNSKIVIKNIADCEIEAAKVADFAQLAYDTELGTTALIDNAMRIAQNISDYKTQDFLQWLVDEQVEEEKKALDFLAKIEGTKELYLLDQLFQD